ERPREL
ncbi:hypothetical protein AZE42_11086, partial [Rhizopogon vesiculosus]